MPNFESLPLSLLNDYLYCPRRAGLKIIEGWRAENMHTVRGDIVHEHADLPGYEVAKNVTLLRALPVFSDLLGLSGKCDVIEQHADGTLLPVEYKKGKRRQFENDDAQLCAQALCLEEMFNIAIPRGAVFHAESKRRRDVIFTPQLRSLTEQAINELHRLVDADYAPLAQFKPACEECSLFKICLPRVTSQPASLRRATAQLFET
jgi:CRISPR-associated exonuclease Cas4